MTLYHCSPSWLEPESVIRPGNYGRILKLIGPSHSHWLREQFLEFVRIQEFPDKPSRLTCAFTCENLDAARFFKSHHKVHLHKEVDEDRGEVRLYCYSEERAKKEEGIARRFAERFERAPLQYWYRIRSGVG